MSTALNPMPPAPSVVSEAQARAEIAARGAAVTIRLLTEPKEHDAAADVIARIWRARPGQSLMPGGLIRVMAYEGCYIAGVFDDQDSGRLVGTAVGFLASDGETPGVHLHSHIAGVVPEVNGRHAGFALKLHQRAWALSRGIDRVTWTFDPLVRGNAYFNLAKLGARASRYLVDFYGANMSDGVNAGQGSDRLLVAWALDSPQVVAAAGGERAGTPPDSPGQLLCETPEAIQALRQADPEQARRWRFSLRRALTEALESGYRISGFTRSGFYVLDHVLDHEGGQDR